MAQRLACSFCLRTQYQVRKLVAGPDVHICDDCVRAASRIIDRQGSPPGGGSLWRRVHDRARQFLADLLSISRSSLHEKTQASR